MNSVEIIDLVYIAITLVFVIWQGKVWFNKEMRYSLPLIPMIIVGAMFYFKSFGVIEVIIAMLITYGLFFSFGWSMSLINKNSKK